jgi:D-glycero-alpha-D-manno-heptose-7-phosphate kinase
MATRVAATAPVRVADVGGWTDTWFGSPGRVCHLAVGPGVSVEAALVERRSGARSVRLVLPQYGHDYTYDHAYDPSGDVAPGRHPLVEQAVSSILGSAPLTSEAALELTVTSAVPAGASLGTSAAVVVAVLGALDVLLAGGSRSPGELAALAHRVETIRCGRQAGVQDQWAAAMGGCGLLEVDPYPEVHHQSVPLPGATAVELAARLVTVVFGAHDSSAVHVRVIDDLSVGDRFDHDRAHDALRRLTTLAGDAADALEAGDVDGWAGVLVASTGAQAVLHPGLVGEAHAAAIEVARHHGATGWKVNGAGGDGGSLTTVAPDGASAALLADALAVADPAWQVVGLVPAGGLTVSGVV